MKKHAFGILVGLWMLVYVYPAVSQPVVADSVLLLRGINAFEGEDYEEAVTAFQLLLEQDSLHAEAHARLARTFKVMGRHMRAANQARLALRDEPENIEYLILRHQIGFTQPTVIDKARKRAILGRILKLDPENAYAHTELGREEALVYIHHKDRIRIPDFKPQPSPMGSSNPNVQSNLNLEAPVLVNDPFDLDELRGRGYTILNEGRRARMAYQGALVHLTKAGQSDPAFQPLYAPLMALLAFEGQHEDMYQWASTMKRFIPDDPYSHLYSGYAAYKLNNLFIAERDFEKGISLLPQDEAAVFKDLSRIMNKDQIKQGLADIEGDRYWSDKDPFQLTQMNERKIEHYARLVFAYLLFGEPKLDMKGWDAERGDVYVRYGEPDRMYYLTMIAEDCDISGQPVSTRSGENNITNFHVFDYGGFRAVFGQSGNTSGPGGDDDPSSAKIPSLNEFPLFSTCASANANTWSLSAQMDYVTSTKGVIRENPTDYQLPGKVVNFPHLTTTFKGTEGLAQVVVTYGYPVALSSSQLASSRSGELFMLGLEVGAFLVNESRNETISLQRTIGSVYFGEMQQYERATLWPGAHRLQVDPGTYRLSVEFERRTDASIGANQEEVTVPDFHSGAFSMSDILLAYFIEEGEEREYTDGIIKRNGFDIQAAPWGVYENDKPVYLYFELYNLKASADAAASYTVEAALVDEKSAKGGRNRLFRRLKRNQGSGVSVSFEGTTNSPDTDQYLIMDTEGLEEGNYVLIVRVIDTVSKEKVERERTIYVR